MTVASSKMNFIICMDLRELPKIDLHCHLDACVRVSTVAEIGKQLGLVLPDSLEAALIAPPVCDGLMDYLRGIDLALEVMQREGDLRRIACELVEDFHADRVIYGEVRFAPQLHTKRGLSLQQVLNAVHAGLEEGKQRYGVLTSLILCCIRQQDPSVSFEIAKLAADNQDKACGIDLAGDEFGFLGNPHVNAFILAERAGLRRTVHAGEAAGSDRILEAIDVLHAERIGHGVRVVEDPRLMSLLKDKREFSVRRKANKRNGDRHDQELVLLGVRAGSRLAAPLKLHNRTGNSAA